MIRQESTYFENFQMETFKEFINGVLVKEEVYNEQGIIIYKKNGDDVRTWIYDDEGRLTYFETTKPPSWVRQIFVNGNLVRQELSDGTLNVFTYEISGYVTQKEYKHGQLIGWKEMVVSEHVPNIPFFLCKIIPQENE